VLRLRVLVIPLTADRVGGRTWSFELWMLDLVLSAVEFCFKLLTGLFELTHALAKTAGKGGEFLGSEEHKDQNRNNDQLRRAEWTEESNEVRVHVGVICSGFIGSAQCRVSTLRTS